MKKEAIKNKKIKSKLNSGASPKSGRLRLGHFKLGSEILVFVFFVLIHLPDLGHDNFNTDVWKWKSRSYNFGSAILGGDFSHTLQTYHPGVTLMWLGSIGARINNFLALINLFFPIFHFHQTYIFHKIFSKNEPPEP